MTFSRSDTRHPSLVRDWEPLLTFRETRILRRTLSGPEPWNRWTRFDYIGVRPGSDTETERWEPVTCLVGAPVVGQCSVPPVAEEVQENIERVVHGVGVLEGRSLKGVGDTRKTTASPEGGDLAVPTTTGPVMH